MNHPYLTTFAVTCVLCALVLYSNASGEKMQTSLHENITIACFALLLGIILALGTVL